MGRSTVSVDLALALQQIGGPIGLVDADVFGPRIRHAGSAHRPAAGAETGIRRSSSSRVRCTRGAVLCLGTCEPDVQQPMPESG